MQDSERLQPALLELRQYVSRRLVVTENIELPVASHPSGQGQLEVKWRGISASILLNPTPDGRIAVDILPMFAQRPWRRVERELLLHIEAGAMLWHWRAFGQVRDVSCVPKPVVAELWSIPKQHAETLVEQCEHSAATRRVDYTELHVVVSRGASQWWLSRPEDAQDGIGHYAARVQRSGLWPRYSKFLDGKVRDCLAEVEAKRIR